MAHAKVAASKSSARSKKRAPTKKAAVKSTAKKAAPVKKSPQKTAVPVKKARGPKKVAAKAAPAAKKKTAPAKTATSGKKTAPVTAKSPFSAKFLSEMEAELRDERETYDRHYRSFRDEAEDLVADFQSGDVQFDEESGEGDTLNVERERDLALSAQAMRAMGEIDHALAKFALGTYGICEVSGDPIPKERLEAIPWARERVEYKTGGLTRR